MPSNYFENFSPSVHCVQSAVWQTGWLTGLRIGWLTDSFIYSFKHGTIEWYFICHILYSTQKKKKNLTHINVRAHTTKMLQKEILTVLKMLEEKSFHFLLWKLNTAMNWQRSSNLMDIHHWKIQTHAKMCLCHKYKPTHTHTVSFIAFLSLNNVSRRSIRLHCM